MPWDQHRLWWDLGKTLLASRSRCSAGSRKRSRPRGGKGPAGRRGSWSCGRFYKGLIWAPFEIFPNIRFGNLLQRAILGRSSATTTRVLTHPNATPRLFSCWTEPPCWRDGSMVRVQQKLFCQNCEEKTYQTTSAQLHHSVTAECIPHLKIQRWS